jgi:hypothetical protein
MCPFVFCCTHPGAQTYPSFAGGWVEVALGGACLCPAVSKFLFFFGFVGSRLLGAFFPNFGVVELPVLVLSSALI